MVVAVVLGGRDVENNAVVVGWLVGWLVGSLLLVASISGQVCNPAKAA